VHLLARPRNDPRQYDDLADQWWGGERSAFAALHWLAVARARLIPPAPPGGGLLLDLACGGGLLAPHVTGYRHLGVDLTASATRIARDHGVVVVQGDVLNVPVRDGCADVVVAGEIFEHVPDLPRAVAEAVRVLRPGGTVVIDTLANTRVCKLLMVTLAERFAVVPTGIHDSDLFVSPSRLRELFAEHGVDITLQGLRPRVVDGLAWVLRVRSDVRLTPTRSTSIVFQGVGVKR
jgi:2-polyprenyl-6-hydroxyphenyl methylase/3-demethylubiquinone-9 3-methyltransferase